MYMDKNKLSMEVEASKSTEGNNDNFVQEMSSVSLDDKVYEQDLTKQSMLQRLSHSDAFFKHQQRGDPDLTPSEKYAVAEEILSKSRENFLERFWKYLEVEDLSYFEKYSNEYEVDFYLKQICKSKSGHQDRNQMKNRRFMAMQKLLQGGEYFSEEEMKYRDPYMYEQLIGQYLTDDEINDKIDKTDLRFSTVLFKHMDILQENHLYQNQRDTEDGQMEEEEDSEEEEESEMEDDDGDKKKTIPNEQKDTLRQEFLTIMQEKFMSGQDEEFNYGEVDNNTEYDDLDVLQKDEEEKYFDDDDESYSFAENCVMGCNMPGDDSKFTEEVFKSYDETKTDTCNALNDNIDICADRQLQSDADQT